MQAPARGGRRRRLLRAVLGLLWGAGCCLVKTKRGRLACESGREHSLGGLVFFAVYHAVRFVDLPSILRTVGRSDPAFHYIVPSLHCSVQLTDVETESALACALVSSAQSDPDTHLWVARLHQVSWITE